MKIVAISIVVVVVSYGCEVTQAVAPMKAMFEQQLDAPHSRPVPAKYPLQRSFHQLSGEVSPQVAYETRRLGDATTNSNLICVAGDQNNEASPLKTTLVEFWYGVETSSSDTSSFLFPLKKQIFLSVTPQILWCYDATNTTGTSQMGRRRHLNKQHVTELDRQRKLANEEARRLGILSFSSGPADVLTSFQCPFKFSNQNCFILHGLLSLFALSTDNLDNTIVGILKAVETAMDDNSLLSSTKLPTVSRVVYLGPNETEAINGTFLNGKGNAGGNNTNVTIVAIQGGGGGTGNRMLTLIAIPIIGLLAILLLLLRQRRSAALKGLLLEEDDYDEDDYVMVGTGDPPGSFHHGNYHYMADGTHYLSTNCVECYRTRRRSSYVYSDRDLPTILEHEVFDDDSLSFGEPYGKLVTADSQDLGAKHSRADVHQCTSGVCEACLAAQRGGAVTFIPTSVRQFDPTALTRVRKSAAGTDPPDMHDASKDGTHDGSMDFLGLSLFETGGDSAESLEVL